jgi:hypothetical protein
MYLRWPQPAVSVQPSVRSYSLIWNKIPPGTRRQRRNARHFATSEACVKVLHTQHSATLSRLPRQVLPDNRGRLEFTPCPEQPGFAQGSSGDLEWLGDTLDDSYNLLPNNRKLR